MKTEYKQTFCSANQDSSYLLSFPEDNNWELVSSIVIPGKLFTDKIILCWKREIDETKS